jgi:plasmid stability protein
MATLTVRNLDDTIVRALRIRAAEHGRSAEAEHREILRHVLTGDQPFAPRAAADLLRESRPADA